MPAPDSVIKRCASFAEHREHFRSGNPNAAQLRKEFLDPFCTDSNTPPKGDLGGPPVSFQGGHKTLM